MRAVEKHMIVVAGLLAFVGLAVVCQPTKSSVPPGPQGGPTGDGSGGGSAPVVDDSRVLLTEFLPTGYVEDASVDYSGALRAATAAAAGGVLVLPDFPILVSRSPGNAWCVRVTEPTTIEGTNGSALVVLQNDLQVVRAEGVDGLTLRDFRVIGTGTDGAGLAHGLVQVTGGRCVRVERLRVDDADADGIAIASAQDVKVIDCVVTNASKASIYVNNSRRVHVRGNTTVDFGGHRTPANDVVGVGIQISSNSDVLCTDNLIDGGVGVGILCNALSGGAAPIGGVVSNNRIRGVRNPTNINASSAIRLANGAPETLTQTIVRGNSIRACGAHGVYVENHDGAVVESNSIVETERCGIVVGTIRGALVARNVLVDIGTEGVPGLDAIHLINRARNVVVRDNEMSKRGAAGTASASDRARDETESRANIIHPRRTAADGPPTTGQWYRGDIVLNADPAASGPVGWVCYANGIPGSWRPFGR